MFRRRCWPGPVSLDLSGSLFPHTMDIVRWLFERDPVEVYAKGHRGVLEGKGVNCWDAIQVLVEFEGKAFCTLRNILDCAQQLYQCGRQSPLFVW